MCECAFIQINTETSSSSYFVYGVRAKLVYVPRRGKRRRALHKYDPLDLHLRQPSQNTIKLAPRPCVTEGDVQAEEIAQAKATGLQVAFTSMNVGKLASMFSINVAADEGMSNDDAWGVAEREGGGWAMGTSGPKTEEMPLFDEEAAYQQTKERGIGFEESDSDSDNDLL